MAYPIRAVLSAQRNTTVILAEATAVDMAARHVALDDGRLAYDYLIVAPGARHSYFAHPEWEEFAPGLKTVEDALAIRRRVLLAFERAERESDPERRRALLTFVVVPRQPLEQGRGGGLTLPGSVRHGSSLAADLYRGDPAGLPG